MRLTKKSKTALEGSSPPPLNGDYNIIANNMQNIINHAAFIIAVAALVVVILK